MAALSSAMVSAPEVTEDASSMEDRLIRELPCQCEKCLASMERGSKRMRMFFQRVAREGSGSFAKILKEFDLVGESGADTSSLNHPGSCTMPRRFLAASGESFCKARHLLTSSLIWRSKEAVFSGTQDQQKLRRATVDHYYTMGLLHNGQVLDRGGRPIWVERTGMSDYNVVAANESVFGDETIEETFLRAHVSLYKQAQGIHAQRLFIYDMYGLSTNHVTTTAMGIIRSMADLDQRNFPGTLHKVLVVNTPTIFQAAFSLVSYMLDPETVAKIQIIGYPKEDEGARQILLEHMDEEVLPAFLGGSGKWAKGGLPLFWKLRRGEGAFEGEKEIEVRSGTVVSAYAEMECGEEEADKAVLELLLRSLSFNVNVEVCAVRRIAGLDVPVVVHPSHLVECQQGIVSIPLNHNRHSSTDADLLGAVVGVRLTFDHKAMWRTRTIYFQASRVPSEAWTVSIE